MAPNRFWLACICFIDSNGNGYPDPSESQTTTAANGTYQFSGLLPGQYPVRVSPLAGFETPVPGNVSVSTNANSVVDLALEQLSLGQIRGQLRTEALDPIAYWNVFADLDNDGELDAGEPTTTSDRGGNYALSGLSAGAYTIRTELPAGWSVASGTNGQSVTLAANAISTGNNFSLRPTNTSVTGGLHFRHYADSGSRSTTNIPVRFRSDWHPKRGHQLRSLASPRRHVDRSSQRTYCLATDGSAGRRTSCDCACYQRLGLDQPTGLYFDRNST